MHIRMKDNLLSALSAQVISLLTSTANVLFIPKLLGTLPYSYWQLFVFYTGYVGFLLLGLNDGVFLKWGGASRKSLDKADISFQLIVSVVSQIVISFFLIVAVCQFSISIERKVVLVSTALYIPLYNIAGFLGSVFQAINEMKEYSDSVIITKIVSLTSTIGLLALCVQSFEAYILSTLIAQLIGLYMLGKKARFLFTEGVVSFSKGIKSTWGYCSSGIKITISSVASMLVIGVCRGCIESGWGVERFGEISVVLSITNFFLLFLQQVSLVLFPSVRRYDKERLALVYGDMVSVFSVLAPIVYLLYFPAIIVLEVWLPQYSSAFNYLGILIGICIFDGRMQLISSTFLKVFRMENTLLAINLLCVFLSSVLSVAGVFLFDNFDVVLWGMVASIMLREIVAEIILGDRLHRDRGESLRGCVASVLMVISFGTCSIALPLRWQFAALLLILLMYLILNRNAYRDVYGMVKARLLPNR